MFLFFQLIYQSVLQYELFYESIIDIESLMFLVEINNLNKKNTMSIVDDIILPTRRHIYNVIEAYNDKKGDLEKNDEYNKKDKVEDKNENMENKTMEKISKEENIKNFSEREANENPIVVSFDDETINNKKYFKEDKSIEDNAKKDFKKNESKDFKKNESKDFKKDLLTLLTILENFSFPLSGHLSIKKNIELRNILFEKDKSQIAKKIYVKKLQNLKKAIMKLNNEDLIKKLILEDPTKKDKKYKKMISNLYKVVISKENFVKGMNREVTEFIQSFEKNIKLKNEDIQDLMMFVNLGGNFVDPRILIFIIRQIMIPKKKAFVEKIINSLLKPIDTLTMYTRYKNCSEKKDALKKFLCNSVKNTPSKLKNQIDEAFKSRSYLLEKYLKDEPEDEKERKLRALDDFQDKTTNKVYEQVKFLDSEKIDTFFIFNRDLLDAYVRFLLNGSLKDKDNLMKFFYQ
ncbi:hypothetical protein DMUE_0901 [Dictyocoela muelleri]|nr:hypothetical protein DMUE_0901 [Dictyocoela muelleri]